MTTAIWSPVSMSSYFDPATGAVKQVSVYFYRAGTLDPITVWTTADQGIPHPIPVLSTGYGRVPPVWIGTEGNPAYRFRVFDQYSTLVEDVDNIPGPEFYVGPGEGEEGGTILPGDPRLNATGDLAFSMSNSQPRLGWVLANGKNIAPTGSVNAPGGRANDDTKALFFWLWGQDLFGQLPLTPPRGSTAQGDWDLSKGIATPDFQGRTLVGMDAMGTTAQNRLANVPFNPVGGFSGHQARMASTGGTAFETLTTAMLPAHAHTATQATHVHANAKAALHNHTATTSVGSENAAHTHTASTNTVNDHTHSVPSGGGTSTAGPGSTSTFTTQAGTNTGGAGSHGHTVTVSQESTNHQHTVTVTVANNAAQQVVTMDTIAPAITVTDTGSGTAHNNTPLIITCAVYIKL